MPTKLKMHKKKKKISKRNAINSLGVRSTDTWIFFKNISDHLPRLLSYIHLKIFPLYSWEKCSFSIRA